MHYVIDLTYIVPLEQVNPHVEEHMAVLRRHAETGAIMASGPKSPRTGGIIVTHDVEESAVQALINDDPFQQYELARYTVTPVRSPLNRPNEYDRADRLHDGGPGATRARGRRLAARGLTRPLGHFRFRPTRLARLTLANA